jgi:hypothetical protein
MPAGLTPPPRLGRPRRTDQGGWECGDHFQRLFATPATCWPTEPVLLGGGGIVGSTVERCFIGDVYIQVVQGSRKPRCKRDGPMHLHRL